MKGGPADGTAVHFSISSLHLPVCRVFLFFANFSTDESVWAIEV